MDTQGVIACFGVWAFLGGSAYAMFIFPQKLIDINLAQRLFAALLCGPIAWLMIVFELLGRIGK